MLALLLSFGDESRYPMPRKQNRAVAARYFQCAVGGFPNHPFDEACTSLVTSAL